MTRTIPLITNREGFGAISGPTSLRSPESLCGVSALPGNDPGYEAWREALATFCERDCLPQMATNLRNGQPLGYLEQRMIDALRAALSAAPTQRKAA